MCDTLCAIGHRRALFGKNSDRPPAEAQLIESFPRREGVGRLRTQYLEIEDTGAYALLGSRPDWLWGLEHGVNEHGVAIGNEKVWTRDDPFKAEPALIGMDLVRLGLERGRTADEALDVMTQLLEKHGQGGVADAHANEPYFSSFLIADARSAWVLETSGSTWVAAPVNGTGAISNRLTIRTEWTREGADWESWRHPSAPTGHADRRLAASRACLAGGADTLTPPDMAAHLRDHGNGPWGAPGSEVGDVSPLPTGFTPDGTGVTVCMHVRAPLLVWVTPGSPCVSVYVPVFPPFAVPAALSRPETWTRFAALRDRVERDAGALAEVREVFAPLETELWAEADEVAGDPDEHRAFVERSWSRVEEALTSLTAARTA
jgi:secernin